jgi:hypothetical protein
VEGDNEGQLVSPRRTVAVDERETPPTRKKKVYKTGPDPKNKDLQIEDSRGKMFNASDGTVKINLAKLILRPVTELEIAEEVPRRQGQVDRRGLLEMSAAAVPARGAQ